MAGNGDAIIALDQQPMEATVKQDFATLESIIADDPDRHEGEPDRQHEVRPHRLHRA